MISEKLYKPLEQLVKPIFLKKIVKSDLFSFEYLTRFEGKFGEDPISCEVALKGNKLFLINLDEETTLIPEKNLKFGLKGFPNHSVEFLLDDQDNVSELLFIYSLGVLQLKINH